MLIRALREIADPKARNTYQGSREVVDVEVPEPQVIGQLNDVRVVASFQQYDGDEYHNMPNLETLRPRLLVERLVGVDAMGAERWERVRSENGVYAFDTVVGALARLLCDRAWTLQPSDYHVVEKAKEEAGVV